MTVYDLLIQASNDASNTDQVFWTRVGIWVTTGITILSALVTILRVILNAINNSNVIGHVLAPQVLPTTDTGATQSDPNSTTSSKSSITSEATTSDPPTTTRDTGHPRISDR